SQFINTAVGRNGDGVGHALESCTQIINCVTCLRPNDNSRRIIFVDTPGFNNESDDLPDWKILKDISEWLARAKRKKIAGIIVLHDLKYPTPKHVPTFIEKLGLSHPLTNVILATQNVQVEAEGRKQEKTLEDQWRNTFDRRPTMIRFQHTRQSAWEIVEPILRNHSIDSLQIRPRVENGRSDRKAEAKFKCNIM
ncbi:uncharacterized protein EDB91DRAFT_1052936, partial [Suillus paluster]|uniref:uncharacterized protein n=1 Tax=Suillus paluster TaxID=48578 RepID=UPI001B86F88E